MNNWISKAKMMIQIIKIILIKINQIKICKKKSKIILIKKNKVRINNKLNKLKRKKDFFNLHKKSIN